MQIATVTEQLIQLPKYWKKPSLRGSPRPKHTNKKWRQNNYYPFGLQHQGYNDIANSCRNEEAEAYKLNGKEFEDSFGLNIYEMDLRQLDPAIGRWTVMDPVVHHDYSPYRAFDNNPVYWSDPSGADSNPSFHLSFQGTEAVHYIFGLIYAMGEINDGQDMIALMNAFDSYEDYVNSIGKTDTNPADENGDASKQDGGGDPKKKKAGKTVKDKVDITLTGLSLIELKGRYYVVDNTYLSLNKYNKAIKLIGTFNDAVTLGIHVNNINEAHKTKNDLAMFNNVSELSFDAIIFLVSRSHPLIGAGYGIFQFIQKTDAWEIEANKLEYKNRTEIHSGIKTEISQGYRYMYKECPTCPTKFR